MWKEVWILFICYLIYDIYIYKKICLGGLGPLPPHGSVPVTVVYGPIKIIKKYKYRHPDFRPHFHVIVLFIIRHHTSIYTRFGLLVNWFLVDYSKWLFWNMIVVIICIVCEALSNFSISFFYITEFVTTVFFFLWSMK